MKYIDAERLKAEIERKIAQYSDWAEEEWKDDREYNHGAFKAFKNVRLILDSLQQEPIEKDEETEKLIVCDIIEATIARINGGKKDEEKEENIMREKIAYLRDLGLKAK